jgi:hypothetical protein
MIGFQKISDMLTQLRRFGSSVATKLATVRDRLNSHEASIKALKQIGAGDVGLKRVENYPPSTLVQAQTGVNNTSVMTPRRTRDWAETNVYEPLGQAFKDASDRLP